MFTINTQVFPSLCNENGELKLFCAFQMMQDCSELWQDSEPYLKKRYEEEGRAQILASRQVDIVRVPLYGEKLTVTTSVWECQPLFGFRNTIIRDEAGNPCYETWSTGAFVDRQTGNFRKLDQPIIDSITYDEKYEWESMCYNRIQMSNKRAVIMGATSGMGKGVALGLLKEGYTIGVAGRRAEELCKIKSLAPDRVFTKVIDITAEDAPSLLLELVSEMGGMDLYFHSSGYGKQNVALDIEIEKKTVMTNSYGFTQMVDTAFGYFKDHGTGHIAVISSVAGTKGLGAAPSYSATKSFDWTYIEALAQLAHMKKLDIKFTDIRPGFVATDFLAGEEKYPLQMPVDYVVKHIVKAVLKGKRKIIIDWKYRIICFFWRLLPSFIWERLTIKSQS